MANTKNSSDEKRSDILCPLLTSEPNSKMNEKNISHPARCMKMIDMTGLFMTVI